MAVNQEYLDYVLDQLSKFGEVHIKKMFGCAGLFHNELMFGKIGGDTFRPKVAESNKKEYEVSGTKRFFSKKNALLGSSS